jgi:hypothetical protein
MLSVDEKCSLVVGGLIGAFSCYELGKSCASDFPSNFVGGYFYGFGFGIFCIAVVIIFSITFYAAYSIIKDCICPPPHP